MAERRRNRRGTTRRSERSSPAKKPSLFARLERVRRFIGPAIALTSGFVSVLLLRRGLEFAPVAVAALLLAWTLVTVLSRGFADAPGESGARKVARWFARYLISAIYQDVLFFLLPIWFGSATPGSGNVAVPIALGALAVFSCFDVHYDRFVLAHPIIRTLITSLILFASLLAAMPVLFSFSLGPNVALAAGASTLLGGIAILPRSLLRSLDGAALLVGLAVGAALLAVWAAPFLPPVPVHVIESATARAISNKEPSNPTRTFEPNVERVYVWFAVAAPKKFSQAVRFRWSLDGKPLTKELETTIIGGRKAGFRTWGYLSSPKPGRWHADLVADSGQLIAREVFDVLPPNPELDTAPLGPKSGALERARTSTPSAR
jgi:uncharacterized protein DUF5924/DUF2914 family protein